MQFVKEEKQVRFASSNEYFIFEDDLQLSNLNSSLQTSTSVIPSETDALTWVLVALIIILCIAIVALLLWYFWWINKRFKFFKKKKDF
jgi:hypothetical protein